MAATRGASALSSTSLVGACAALLLALRVVNFVHSTGELRHLENINAYSGRCTRHNGEHRGFEDFAVFDGGQLVSLASDHSHFAFKWGVSMRDRLKVTKGAHAVHAKVLRGGKWRSFELRGVPSDFAPHGLAAWGRLSGGTLLVVNHRTTHDTLEIFATLPHGARHQSSHAHPLLYNVNDCSFATARLVFCTNWRSHETGTVMDAVEVYGQQPWSNVVACELGKLTHCVLAADGLQMANGIEVIGEHVAVVSSLEPAIRVYSRAPAARASDARASDARAPDARLELLYKINTRSACDNLVRTTDGRGLITACHPKALTFVRHSKAPRQLPAPCEVLLFDDVLNASRRHAQGATYPSSLGTPLYVDAKGDEFSACSVAAIVNEQLWIGAVHDAGLLRCNV